MKQERKEGGGQGVPLLSIEDIAVVYQGNRPLRVVDGVSFRVNEREIVALVGESGCGKSTVGWSIVNLIPPPGRVVEGKIRLEGRDVLSLSSEDVRRIRGAEASVIVQDALAVMNPVTRVEEQVREIIQDHHGSERTRRPRERVLSALRDVGLEEADRVARSYAHELSGGMQQRVVIAEALVMSPKIIVADEPTTALDVTVQKQVLELLRVARDQLGTSTLLITHDLAIVAETCDRMVVMYAGVIVETGPVDAVFARPLHPYTRALLDCLPPLAEDPPRRLKALPGQPPRPEEWPTGCRFHPRCPLYATVQDPRCRTERPLLAQEEVAHGVACHLWREARTDFRLNDEAEPRA